GAPTKRTRRHAPSSSPRSTPPAPATIARWAPRSTPSTPRSAWWSGTPTATRSSTSPDGSARRRSSRSTPTRCASSPASTTGPRPDPEGCSSAEPLPNDVADTTTAGPSRRPVGRRPMSRVQARTLVASTTVRRTDDQRERQVAERAASPIGTFRKAGVAILAVSLVAVLAACSSSDDDESAPTTVGSGDRYAATIRRTTGGVPHITGKTLADASFGEGWASGQDRACDLADQVIKVRGERARWLGAGEDDANVDSDAAWRAIGIHERAVKDWEEVSEELNEQITA